MKQEAGQPKRYLGSGRSDAFRANAGETLVEIGGSVFAVGADFFCKHCDGAGCKSCKWTGEARRK